MHTKIWPSARLVPHILLLCNVHLSATENLVQGIKTYSFQSVAADRFRVLIKTCPKNGKGSEPHFATISIPRRKQYQKKTAEYIREDSCSKTALYAEKDFV